MIGIQEARDTTAGIIINPGAFTHTSIAILDALNTYDGPVVEIHISQVHKREEFSSPIIYFIPR